MITPPFLSVEKSVLARSMAFLYPRNQFFMFFPNRLGQLFAKDIPLRNKKMIWTRASPVKGLNPAACKEIRWAGVDILDRLIGVPEDRKKLILDAIAALND